MISDIDSTISLHLNNEAQFLCFTLSSDENNDAELYGINIFKIREIIHYEGDVTETVGGNESIMLGFLTIRGESVPLIDVNRWLYFDPNNPNKDLSEASIKSDQNLVIVCEFSGCVVGLRIFAIKRIVHKSWGEISVGDKQGFNTGGKVSAITRFEQSRVIQILDVERMLVEAFPTMQELDQLKEQLVDAIRSDKLIFIAEDSQVAMHNLERIIEGLKLKYEAFPNGDALLKRLFTENMIDKVGAVITDLEMPVVSGFEVLKRIKADARTKHLPVIVNSSMSSESNKQLADSLHADGFVIKSHPHEIQELLQEYLRQ
ncbi:chemotaxis protein [Helicobacter ailurogastricus]|uniref:chemotaxis protein n=1 Tax=Helicobacter ailurogastricus TaxID=1578720 RepID=UPI0022C73FFA|nr:chemotaxis protein [Helicobacter ailurogastricus]GLH57250.1 Chemotaxis protein [Helicobacter ailurogastricus]GLH59175.1 Chemotaxis protein [Helicobacter ailurogastricus]